jgi:hypothetical protein
MPQAKASIAELQSLKTTLKKAWSDIVDVKLRADYFCYCFDWNDEAGRRFVERYEKQIEPIDSSKLGRNELLFITFFTLHEYYSKYNSLPELNNKKQMDEIVKRTEELYNKNYKLCKEGKIPWFAGVQDWEEKIPKQVASWSRAEISPLCSFLGVLFL